MIVLKILGILLITWLLYLFVRLNNRNRKREDKYNTPPGFRWGD